MLEDHLTQGIPESAIHQVNKMIEQDIDSAIDIGSGPGSVVFELAKHDLSKVIGIDLSDEMINISNRRLSEFNYDNVEFIQSSILNFENQPIDGVSMHRMICCHPNKDEVIDKPETPIICPGISACWPSVMVAEIPVTDSFVL